MSSSNQSRTRALCERLAAENKALKAENEQVTAQNTVLRAENERMRNHIKRLLQQRRSSLTGPASDAVAQQQSNASELELLVQHEAVLQTIFSLIGLQDHWFVASISKLWRKRYTTFTGTRLETDYRAAITTPTRLRLAFMNGMSDTMSPQSQWRFAVAVCTVSVDPISILVAFRERGLPWSTHISNAIAGYRSLDMLQQITALGVPWMGDMLRINACKQATDIAIPILEWVNGRAEWTAAGKIKAMTWAACHGHIETVAWLRERAQVPWPTDFLFRLAAGVDLNGPRYRGTLMCWKLPVIQWAFANGCGWAGWRCQHYAEGWYLFPDHQTAFEVLQWAHEQEDCPCTCHDDAGADV